MIIGPWESRLTISAGSRSADQLEIPLLRGIPRISTLTARSRCSNKFGESINYRHRLGTRKRARSPFLYWRTSCR